MALNLYADLEGQGKLFSTVAEHYRWYFILLGEFPDRSSAEAWRGNLPDWAANAPHIGFGEVQQERCDQAGFLTGDEAVGLTEFCRI